MTWVKIIASVVSAVGEYLILMRADGNVCSRFILVLNELELLNFAVSESVSYLLSLACSSYIAF